MKSNSFSIQEALRFGWETTKSNFSLLLSLLIISALVSIVPDVIAKMVPETVWGSSVYWLVWIAAVALGFVIDVSLIFIMLRFVDKEGVKVSMIFSQYRLTFRYVIAAVFYGLMVVFGLILLIVPGIYFALRYQFYAYALVDKQADIFESFKISASLTEGEKLALLRFFLILVLINIAGALVFLVGLFVTMPLSMLSYAYVYRKLSSRPESDLSSLDKQGDAGQQNTLPVSETDPQESMK